MDKPRRYYAKWNKSDKERLKQYDFTYMCNLKNNINKQNRNRLTVARGEEALGTELKRLRDWEVQIRSYKIVVGM